MSSEPSFASFGARCELVLEVTLDTLRSDPDLRLCEGLRLIEATRRAIERMEPQSLRYFENMVVPFFRDTLMERFGVAEPFPGCDQAN